MKNKLSLVMCLLLIGALSGCAGGVKNSMRPSTKSSAWNPGKVAEKETTWNPVEAITKEKKWDPLDALNKKDKDEEESAEAVTVTAIWKDSTYEKPGTPLIRGFGGRFFFYDEDSNPVKAEGELVIYGFDDSSEEDKKGPDKKFVFRETEFQSHYSESGLGHSYSVWIPWDKADGVRKMITLIPIFRRSDGTILKCGQSTSVLKGTEPENEIAQNMTNQPFKYLGSSSAIAGQASEQPAMVQQSNATAKQIQQVGYAGTDAGQSRIKTSTIKLPPSMAQRIATARTNKAAEIRTPTKTGTLIDNEIRIAKASKIEANVEERDNSFPLKPLSAQSESSESSVKSIPRNVFGSPGSLN